MENRHATSLIAQAYATPDYTDRFVATVEPDRFASVDELARTWFVTQPRWVQILSANTLSRGTILAQVESTAYQSGDAVGSWVVVERTHDEIMFGQPMGFMEYRFSFRRPDESTIEVATAVVYLWRRTGKVYFSLVKPMHRRFVRIIIDRLARP